MHRPETKAVALGRGERGPGAPLNVGPVFASTYRADGPITYGREGSATVAALEEVVGALEGGPAIAFSSGMAAISAVVEALPAGATVVTHPEGYYGTRRMLTDRETKGRVAVRSVDMADLGQLARAAAGADLVWVESPTNPTMAVLDIAAIVAVVPEGVPVAVDNTFATPLRQRPIELGATLAVHSATKLLGGHSDLVLGVAVAASEEWADAVRRQRLVLGALPGTMEAFLAIRGIRTLAVRLDRSEATATELARRLARHPGVERVRYPGFGTVLSYEVRGGAEAAEKVSSGVQLIVHGTSLGGVESLMERRNRWAGEEATPASLLRLSVGLEHVEDLWDDLAQALDAITPGGSGTVRR